MLPLSLAFFLLSGVLTILPPLHVPHLPLPATRAARRPQHHHSYLPPCQLDIATAPPPPSSTGAAAGCLSLRRSATKRSSSSGPSKHICSASAGGGAAEARKLDGGQRSGTASAQCAYRRCSPVLAHYRRRMDANLSPPQLALIPLHLSSSFLLSLTKQSTKPSKLRRRPKSPPVPPPKPNQRRPQLLHLPLDLPSPPRPGPGHHLAWNRQNRGR
ncbi:unnamed protein product [Urochloa humidicola]